MATEWFTNMWPVQTKFSQHIKVVWSLSVLFAIPEHVRYLHVSLEENSVECEIICHKSSKM
jgi:hypothetical protein